jgi:hypothetical protein
MVLKKRYDNKFFFTPVLSLLFLDPGSGIAKNQDPGSGKNIPDPQHWIQIRHYLSGCGSGSIILPSSSKKVRKP